MAPSNNAVVFVFDINGVFADIRKPHVPRPLNRMPDLYIKKTKQSVYFRPDLTQFINDYNYTRFNTSSNVFTVLWTTKNRNNSGDIEWELFNMGFYADLYLHGEDCKFKQGMYPLRDCLTVRNRVADHYGEDVITKDVRIIFVDNRLGKSVAVRRKVSELFGETYDETPNVMFLDDNPYKDIKEFPMGYIINVKTYKAGSSAQDDNDGELDRVMSMIRRNIP